MQHPLQALVRLVNSSCQDTSSFDVLFCCSYGAGTNDGCISKDMPYDTDGLTAARLSSPPKRPADRLRNIYTSAPKTGGYGMPWKDMSIGEPPKYYMDVYDGGREIEKVW